MYLLVNNKKYIVAISQKFLSKIDTTDICSISTMIIDGFIELDYNTSY